jgi:hypothetical protein
MCAWLLWRGVLRLNEDPQHVGFWCPGCKTLHIFDERWKMDPKSTFEKPTFAPSLVTSKGHHVAGAPKRPDGKCGRCEDAKERGKPTICGRCHLWVRNGEIEFLADCTHELRGTKVAMTVHDEP